MKAFSGIVFIALFISCTLNINTGSTVEGSVETVSRQLDIGSVQPIEFDINSVSDVSITHGDTYSVNILINENFERYVEIYEYGEVLYIRLEEGQNYKNLVYEIAIVSPDVSSVKVDGVSSCKLTNFTFDHDLYLAVDGASSISAINCELNGILQLDVDGTSSADLSQLPATRDARITIDGVSSAWIDTLGTISGSVAGVSTLYYRSGNLAEDFEIADITSSAKRY